MGGKLEEKKYQLSFLFMTEFLLFSFSLINDLSLLLQTDQLLKTIVHLLDGLVFSQTHAALVRDVVDATLSLGVFTTSTANLFILKNKYLISIALTS